MVSMVVRLVKEIRMVALLVLPSETPYALPRQKYKKNVSRRVSFYHAQIFS